MVVLDVEGTLMPEVGGLEGKGSSSSSSLAYLGVDLLA
jgi:hypothetical protein